MVVKAKQMKFKHILVFLITSFIILFLASQIYRVTFSMKVAHAFEVNSPTFSNHLLIATQGSPFKDSVLQTLVEQFKRQDFFIKVIDIKDLEAVDYLAWDAICLIHTWENQKPPKVVRSFLAQLEDNRKVIALATSTFGNFRLKEVDAVSGASSLEHVPILSNWLIKSIEKRVFPEVKPNADRL